jgi:hypothetical protein
MGRIQDVAERCFVDGMMVAAKMLYNSISNFARLATCLARLGEHQVKALTRNSSVDRTVSRDTSPKAPNLSM